MFYRISVIFAKDLADFRSRDLQNDTSKPRLDDTVKPPPRSTPCRLKPISLTQRKMKLSEILKDKERLHRMVSDDDTPEGKAFDLFVMCAIVLSLVLAFVESSVHVDEFTIQDLFSKSLTKAGWVKLSLTLLEYLLTLFFTLEYALRVYCEPRKKDYVLSMFGIVDFLATFPQLLSIFIPQLKYLSIMRSVRLLRIFRVLKLFTFINEGYLLIESVKRSLNKLIVYFLFVTVLVVILGTIMYMIEGDIAGSSFSSIPDSIYWAIVTLTTVGYGDITPVTLGGKIISSMVMILGYTIIAVPTGIVSATMIDATKKKGTNGRCPRCNQKTDLNANYCKHCGERL